MCVRQHVHARSQLNDLRRCDAELATLRTRGMANEADDIAAFDAIMKIGERLAALLVIASIGKNLQLRALRVQIIEDEFCARQTL